MSKKLEGKIALVTGGTTGIGLATAKRFAEEGAHVYITGRRQAELDKVVELVGNATGIAVDSSGTAAFSVYSASKAAVRAFARSWTLDLKDRAIRVNTLSPGATRTPGLVDLAGPDAAQQQRLLDYLASQVPLGRVGEPVEIANAAVFLASDDSSFVNGAELFVDGGQAQI